MYRENVNCWQKKADLAFLFTKAVDGEQATTTTPHKGRLSSRETFGMYCSSLSL